MNALSGLYVSGFHVLWVVTTLIGALAEEAAVVAVRMVAAAGEAGHALLPPEPFL